MLLHAHTHIHISFPAQPHAALKIHLNCMDQVATVEHCVVFLFLFSNPVWSKGTWRD